MEPVRRITGTALPLDRSDVDTDQIIPSDWLKRVERTGFGKGLFSEWREDPNFVMNLPQFDLASIIVAGPNFGTGSSREHAVWALMDYGFRAVISSRFGDIFSNNSTKSGLVPVRLEPDVVETILHAVEKNPDTEIIIDVETLTVLVSSLSLEVSFHVDPFTQQRLLEGWDDIGLTLRSVEEIDRFETTRPSHLPTTNT